MFRLKDLREDMDLTQIKLASEIGCSQTTYSRYENEILNIPIDILLKLADFYGVSVDYILGLTDQKQPYKRSNLFKINNK